MAFAHRTGADDYFVAPTAGVEDEEWGACGKETRAANNPHNLSMLSTTECPVFWWASNDGDPYRDRARRTFRRRIRQSENPAARP